MPDVVHTTSAMIVIIATDGPDSQSHNGNPPTVVSSRNLGGPSTPNSTSASCSTPRESVNQFGPWIPTNSSSALTAPEPENRNRKITEMATELVIDGK